MDRKDPPLTHSESPFLDSENRLVVHKDSDIQRENSVMNSSMHSNAAGYKYIGEITRQDVIVFALYIALFSGIIVADIYYQEPLFQLDLEVIPGIQETFSEATIMYFKLITLCGYGAAGAVFIFIFFTFSSRDKAFYLLFV